MKKTDNLFTLRTRRIKASFRDHFHLLFKSAAHNHLRLQQIRRAQSGEDFCTVSFPSYTALKQYQKKTRIFGFGLSTSLAVLLVSIAALPAFFTPDGSKAAVGPAITSITPNSGPAAGGTNVTISGSNFDEGIDSNTKLLIHGDGEGSSFVDSSVYVKTINVSGSATQSSVQSKFGGKSSLLQSGSYLTVPTSQDFEFAGDYTVDAWIYPTAYPSSAGYIIDYGVHTTGSQFWDLAFIPNGQVVWSLYNSGYLYSINSTTSVPLNTWTHVAAVRNGNQILLFVNGVQEGSATYSGTFTPTGKTLFIGRHATNTDQYFNGYIDELRVTKGIARWTGNFSPLSKAYSKPNVTFGGTQASNILLSSSSIITTETPSHDGGTVDVVVTNDDSQSSALTNGYTYTAPPTISSITPNSGSKVGGDSVTITGTNFSTGLDSYVKLLLHADGSGNSFVDSELSAPKNIIANGSATQSTSDSKFGGSSILLNGTSDYLSIANSSDFNFGNSDFTIDGWINIKGGTDAGIYSQKYGTGGISSFAIILFKTGGIWKLLFGASTNGTAWDVSSGYIDTPITENQWNHVAVVRNGSTWTSYVNGQAITSLTSGITIASPDANPMVGLYQGAPGDNRYFNGYIDEFRISKGIARWTSNFTPQDSSYGIPGVTFDGQQANDIVSLSSSEISAKTPSHAAGTVDVTVINPDTQSATLSNGFTYNELPPSITSITPNSGSTDGGANVTISGNNFAGGIDEYVKLFMRSDGTGSNFVDSSITPKTLTANGTATQTATQSKFGGSSAYFGTGGTTSNVTTNTSSDFDLGTSDFTIDAWIYPTSFTTYRPIFSNRSGDTALTIGYDMLISVDGGIYLHARAADGTDIVSFNSLNKTTLNSWNHVAFIRSGSSFYISVNGALELMATSSKAVQSPTNRLIIGNDFNGSNSFPGFIDEFRFTKGIARWTSNFSVPASAYQLQPTVKFDGVSATDVFAINETTITVTTPTHAAGSVNVVVTNYDGQNATLTNGYTYTAPPTISSVTPSSGLKTGGDSVTITGTNFYGTPIVKLGGADATNVTVVNSTTITATTPAHIAGSVDIAVINPDTQSATLSNGFTYNELPPSITSITPDSGSTDGGISVTISGNNFAGGIDEYVKLFMRSDGTGSNFVDSSITPKTLTANGAATQSATQSKFGGSSAYFGTGGTTSNVTTNTSSDFDLGTSDFTIDTWIYPLGDVTHRPIFSNRSGDTVSNIGYDLLLMPDNSLIAEIYASDDTLIASSNSIDKVTLNSWNHVALIRNGNNFYISVNGILNLVATSSKAVQNPTSFLMIGNDFRGPRSFAGFIDEFRFTKGIARWTSNFSVPTFAYQLQPTVTFDGVSATDVFATSESTITATTPAHAAGSVNVVVTNYDGQNATLTNGYTYTAPPTISSVTPSSGLKTGGDSITITGTNFYGTPTVKLGSTDANNVTVVNSTTITATTPTHDAGIVDVTVINPDTQSATLSNGFTYNELPPSISSIEPASGPVSGGNMVTINGSGFFAGNQRTITIGNNSGSSLVEYAVQIEIDTASMISSGKMKSDGSDIRFYDSSQMELLSYWIESGINTPKTKIWVKVPLIPTGNHDIYMRYGNLSLNAMSSLNSVFSVLSSSSNKLWLNANREIVQYADGAAASQWIDMTGNGNNAVQATSSKMPAYIGNVINGNAAMRFDGISDTMAHNFSGAVGSNSYSYFVVFKLLTNSSQQLIFRDNYGSNSTAIHGYATNSAGFYRINNVNGALSTSISNEFGLSPHLVDFEKSGTSGKVYRDGSLRDSFTVSFSKLIGTTMNLAYNTGYSDYSNVDIAEVLLFDGELSTQDRQTIEKYINQKYALSNVSSLPTVSVGDEQGDVALSTVVSFDGLAATEYLFVDSSTLNVIVPAHAAGTVDVVVTNYDGQSATLTNGYTYIAPPTVSGIGPSSVTNNQNTNGINISGTDFQNGATVKFKMAGEDDIVCSNVIFNSASSLSCDGDFHGVKPGAWDVEVTNVDGQIGTGSGILDVIGEITQIKFITPSYTVKPNIATEGIRIQLQDSAGRPTKPQSEVTLDLSETSSTGEFSLSKSSWASASSVSFTTNDSHQTVYYKDSTFGTFSISAVENPSSNWTDASQDIIISNSAPFVWPFDVSTDYQYDSAKIGISDSNANLTDLSASGSEIKNVVSESLPYSSLNSFSEVLGVDNQGSVKYQLSNDDGVTWYWWNGSTWTSTSQGTAQANDAATINANISNFNANIGQIGNAKLSFKAFLIGDGSQNVSLDSIFVGYAWHPYKYVFSQKPANLNETEEGTFVVQAQDQNGNVIPVDHDTVISLTTSTPASGFFATNLSEDVSTRWDKTTVTIPAGQNSATFYYKDSLKGNKTISANPPAGETSVAATYSLNVTSRYRFIVTGVSDPISAGVPSSITVQASDYLGNPVTNYTGTLHFTSTDLAASLPVDSSITAQMLGTKTYVNGVTMMTQAEQCITVTDVSDPVITGSQCDITVGPAPAGVASKLKIISQPQYVPVGQTSNAVTVQLQDVNNEAATKATATTVYVYRTTASGEFSSDGVNGWTSGAFSINIPAGATSANFYYRDTVIGNYEVTVSDDSIEGQDLGLINYTQSLSAVAGDPFAFSFDSSPVSLAAGVVSGALEFSLRDSQGNKVTTSSNQNVFITTNNGGELSLDGNTWSSSLSLNMLTGASGGSFYYRNNDSGTFNLTISDSDPADAEAGLDDISFDINVGAAAVSQFVFVTSPVNVEVGQVSPIVTVQARDIYGNVVVAASDIPVYLYSSDADTEFSASASPFVSVNEITITAGSSTASFYFKQNIDNGNITITVSDNASAPDADTGIADASQVETVSQGSPTQFVITNASPMNLNAGEESMAIVVESKNSSNVKVPVPEDKTIYFHTDSTASIMEFSLDSSPSWTAISSAVWPAGSDTMTFYYKDTQSGLKNIIFGDDAISGNESGLINATVEVDVEALSPNSLKIISSPITVEAGQKGQVDIQLQDQYGNVATQAEDRVITLSSDDANGVFYNGSNNVITQFIVSAGSSSVSFYYKNDSASTQNITIASDGLTSDTQLFTVVTGAPVVARLSIAQNNLTAGVVSDQIMVKLYNSHGIETITPSNQTVNIATNSATGHFDSLSNGTFSSNSLDLIIASGSSSSSFFFRDAKSGSLAIYSNGGGLTQDSLNLTVSPAAADHLEFTSGTQTITAGNISSAITGKVYDAFENQTQLSSDLLVNLATTSSSAEFSLSDSSWSPITEFTIPAGSNSFSLFYKDQNVDVVDITLSTSLGNITQSHNIISGTLQNDAPVKLLFQSAPQTLIIDSPAGFDFYLANSLDQYTVAQGSLTATISSNSATGLFSDGSGSWSATLEIDFQAGESVKSFQYRDSISGAPIITISSTGLTSAQQQQNVINGNIEKIILEAQSDINTVDRIPVTIKTVTNGDLLVAVTSDTFISLTKTDGNFYADYSSQTPINSTTLNSGSSSKTVYFQKTTPGNVTISVDESPSNGWTSAQMDINVTSVPTRFSFTTSAQSKKAGMESDIMTIVLEDIYGNVSNTTTDLTLYLSSSSQFGQFSLQAGSDWSQTSSVTMNSGTSIASFYYKDTLAGNQTITVSDVSSPAENPDTGYNNATQQFTITPDDIFALKFLTSVGNLEIGQVSGQITVQAQDQYGNAKILDNDFIVYPYITSANGKFSLSTDFGSQNLISNFKILAGTSAASFYFKTLDTGTFDLTVSDKNVLDNPDSGIINDLQQIAVSQGNVAKLIWESVPSTLEEGERSAPIIIKTANSSGIEIPVSSDLTVHYSLRNTTPSNGSFANDAAGPWNAVSTIIPSGSSRATFYFKDTIEGTVLLTVSDEAVLVDGQDSGLSNASSYINIVKGSITKIVFTSADQTVIANHPSLAFQIQTLNKFDVPTNTTENKIVYLRSSSASGEFSLNGLDWGINGATIETGSSSATFYYRDAFSGQYNITAADTLPLDQDASWTNAVQQVSVIAQQLHHFNVRNISDPQKQGTPSSVVVSPVDAEGYVIKEYAGTITEFRVLDADGNSEPAVMPEVPYTFNPAVDKGTKTFTNSVAFFTEGEKTFSVIDNDGFVGLQENITVVSSSSDPVERIRFIDVENPLYIAKRTSSPLVTVQLQDDQGEPVRNDSADGYNIKITPSSSDAEFSLDGNTWEGGEIILNVPQYLNYATFYYRNADKVSEALIASDWQNSVDDTNISNDELQIEVIAGEVAYFEVSGSNSQIAGEQQEINITAKDEDGDTAISFAGEKEVSLSGASDSFTDLKPTCTDKENEAIELGQVMALEFVDGQASCTLKLFRKEMAEIKVQGLSIDSYSLANHNLSINVAANLMHVNLSVLSALPNPQQVGGPVEVIIVPKDIYGNVSGKSAGNVLLFVNGANAISGQQFNFDIISGNYKTSYTPQNSGTDLITATLDGISIKQDSDGISDGIFHESIQGDVIQACGYINLDSEKTEDKKLVFDTCISSNSVSKSNTLSKSDTESTYVSRLEVEAGNKDYLGEIEIKSSSDFYSDANVPSDYTDTSKFLQYVNLMFVWENDSNSIAKTKVMVIVSNRWLESNNIYEILALGKDGQILNIEKIETTSDNTIYEISDEEAIEYLSILGKVASNEIVISDDTSEEDSESETEEEIIAIENTPINNIIESIVGGSSNTSDGNKKSSNIVSDSIAKLFGLDEKNATQILNTIAVISTGAALASAGAATAASFPMLSYALGVIRAASAVPYRKKQKWGVVYDSQTGKPLASALVIISDDKGKVKEMKNTDMSGFYSFLAPEGKYVIDVRKSGYIPAQTAHMITFETYYDDSYICGNVIDIKEEQIISLNIPMIRKKENLLQKVFNPSTVTHLVFWGGFVFSIFAVSITPSYLNMGIVAFFVLSFIFNVFYKQKIGIGKVVNSDSKPVGFASIKVFDKEGKMVARTIANEKGTYALVLNEGEYVVEVQSGAMLSRKEIKLENHSELREKLILY